MAIITGMLTFILLGVVIVRSGSILPPATFPNAPGFKQAIFWFEMAGSGKEIAAVLGDPATDMGRRILTELNWGMITPLNCQESVRIRINVS